MEEEKSLLKKMAEMFSDDDDEENVSEEIMALARVAKEQQKLSAAEVERLRNILMFCEKDVKDAMSHRKDIVGIDEETILEDAIRFMLKERYSRFPIYEEDIDNIKGILHIRDAMRMYLIPGCQRRPLKELGACIQKVNFVPETRSAEKMMSQMQKGKMHMAVVLDEYGQTSGLITMEDLVEEIVGDILDEYDKEEYLIVPDTDGSYIVQGKIELDELGRSLGITFEFDEEDDEYETLNGFLVYQLDKIPSEDEKCRVSYKGYLFEVVHVVYNVIQQVCVRKEV